MDEGKFALLSVSNKEGLVPFARSLAAAGYNLLSTGGTARVLREAELEVIDVAEYTGFPELMGGRLKTLHPLVHGGILHRREHAEDMAACAAHGIARIDLVVVNLYPFEARAAKPDITSAALIEQVDIGGPTMLRAAAKNHAFVTVVVDPDDYADVVSKLHVHAAVAADLRRRLAQKAFAHTAAYDAAIAKNEVLWGHAS